MVIGNSDYQNYPDLHNPTNDAQAIGTILRRLGFEVAVGLDLDAVAFRKAIRSFLQDVDQDTVALFFYAGHGVQVNGLNYMLPTDVQIASLSDLEFETIRFNLVLKPLEQSSNIAIVFLDACRNNPLAATMSGKNKDRSLGSSRGLAPVQVGDGLFIGYATQPDSVAVDGDGPNSPFTAALLHHLETPGSDIEMLMRRVRDDVIAATNHAQVPWSNSSLSSEGFSFNPTDMIGAPVAAVPSDPNVTDKQLELELWRSIGESSDTVLLEGYLRRYPGGIFSDIARARLKGFGKKSKNTSIRPNGSPKPKQSGGVTAKKPVKSKNTTQAVQRSVTSKPSPNVRFGTGTRCRDGDIAWCRVLCQRGKQVACDRLRRMGL